MKNKRKQLINNQTQKRYWLYGRHAVIAAIYNSRRTHHKMLLTKSAFSDLQSQIKNATNIVHYDIVDSNNISKISQIADSVHQGIVLETEPLEQPDLTEVMEISNAKSSTLVLLDQVTDPQNIGALMRIALAFSSDAVITTFDHSPKETAALVKAASGAFELLPFIKVVNLAHTIKLLKKSGYWTIGFSGYAKDFFDPASKHFFKKTAIILGSEGSGLRKLTEDVCDFSVKIQMCEQMESLNIASAASIALYEIFKHRQ